MLLDNVIQCLPKPHSPKRVALKIPQQHKLFLSTYSIENSITRKSRSRHLEVIMLLTSSNLLGNQLVQVRLVPFGTAKSQDRAGLAPQTNIWRPCSKWRGYGQGQCWDARLCMSNKLPGDTQPADQSREPHFQWQRERNEKKSNFDLKQEYTED